MFKKIAAVAAVSITLAAFSHVQISYASSTGKASWYQCCKKTANGEKYNPDGLTAAHRTLPFGTKVLVENLKNGKKVTVRINDRGPFIKGRLIDLSRGAAKHIGLINTGVANVRMTVLK